MGMDEATRRSGSIKPYASASLPNVVLSPPGRISPSSPYRCSGSRTSTTSIPSFFRISSCSWKSPWRASTPIFNCDHHPRTASRACSGNSLTPIPTIGSPRPWLTSASIFGSL